MTHQPAASAPLLNRTVVFVAAFAVIVGATVGILQLDRDLRVGQDETKAEATYGDVALALDQRVTAGASELRASRDAVALRGALAVSGGGRDLVGVAVVDAISHEVLAASSGFDLGSVSELSETSASARDTQRIELSAPIDGRVYLVAPLYRTAEGFAAVPELATTQGRRDSIASYVIAALDLEAAVASVTPDRPVQVLDGGKILAASSSTNKPSTIRARGRVSVLERQWEIVVGGGSLPGPSTKTVGSLVGVWSAMLLFGVEIVRRDRRSARFSSEISRERQRTAVITDLAPVLQQSLQLAEVLPTLALQLSDRFGLRGLTVNVAEDGGRTAELFAHGDKPDPAAVARASLGVALEPGSTASLALTRAGRMVAELRLVAGDALDVHDLASIEASAELVSSAIVTAQAVDRQQHAVDQLTELDSLKTVFLSTAAHELRTPVAAVRGLSDMLALHWDTLPEPDRKLMAGRIAANGASLAALVQDLLDFSRLETGELTTGREPVDVASIVQGVVDRLTVVWQTHTVNVDAEPGPAIEGDALALERILTNLVSNATKYSPEGSTVTVSVAHGRGRALLTVDDEGPGIAPEDRERIFGRFYRGGGPEVLRTRGVGIGLSVVREFVRQLDGHVEVSESPSGGARFTCSFPHSTRATDANRNNEDPDDQAS